MNMTFLRKLHATRQLGKQRPRGLQGATGPNRSRTGDLWPNPQPIRSVRNQVSKSNLNSFSATDQRLLGQRSMATVLFICCCYFLSVCPAPLTILPFLNAWKMMLWRAEGQWSRRVLVIHHDTPHGTGSRRTSFQVLVYYASSCQSQGAHGAYERRNANLKTGRGVQPPPPRHKLDINEISQVSVCARPTCKMALGHDWLTLCKFLASHLSLSKFSASNHLQSQPPPPQSNQGEIQFLVSCQLICLDFYRTRGFDSIL